MFFQPSHNTNKKVVITLLILVFQTGISTCFGQHILIDKQATEATKQLYQFLNDQSGKHLLFGHHRTTTSGLEWQDKKVLEKKSDVKSAVGDFPAIFSFDFGLGFDQNIKAAKHAHLENAIVTFSWHMKNLATDKNCYDTSGSVMERILPNGDLHHKYLNQLNQLATFANNLILDRKHIPIIFRPFHENTGDWFWWGAKFCSPEIYKEVWKFTVDYLKNTKNVHNLIFAYSPSKPAQLENESYETRYPGNEYVDIIGFDNYGVDNFSEELIANCRLVVEFAQKNNKVAAITETGVRKGIQNTLLANWYVDALLNPLKNDSIAKKVAYVVTWTNSKKHRWIPLKNDIHYKGFVQFYEDDYTWFAADLKKQNISKK